MRDFELTQEMFKRSILQLDSIDTSFIKSSHPAERLDIYRQTILEN